MNTYSVFAETFRTVIAADGSAGIVTPTGLVTDKTTSVFFGDLVSTQDPGGSARLRDQPSHLDRRRKPQVPIRCDPRSEAVPCQVERIRMSFFNKYPTDVTSERVFSVTPDEIQLLNPNTGNCPAFITRADADLTIGVYRRHPVFIRDDSPVGNPWGVTFMTMFHMANDSGLSESVPT